MSFLLAINNGCNSLLPDIYNHLRQGTDCKDLMAFNNINVIGILLANLVQIALALAGIAGVGVIIVAGILYTTSNGNTKQIEQAKNTIINWAIGLIIIIGAYVIVGLIAGTFS